MRQYFLHTSRRSRPNSGRCSGYVKRELLRTTKGHPSGGLFHFSAVEGLSRNLSSELRWPKASLLVAFYCTRLYLFRSATRALEVLANLTDNRIVGIAAGVHIAKSYATRAEHCQASAAQFEVNYSHSPHCSFVFFQCSISPVSWPPRALYRAPVPAGASVDGTSANAQITTVQERRSG